MGGGGVGVQNCHLEKVSRKRGLLFLGGDGRKGAVQEQGRPMKGE